MNEGKKLTAAVAQLLPALVVRHSILADLFVIGKILLEKRWAHLDAAGGRPSYL